jgi:hypothetical protein
MTILDYANQHVARRPEDEKLEETVTQNLMLMQNKLNSLCSCVTTKIGNTH